MSKQISQHRYAEMYWFCPRATWQSFPIGRSYLQLPLNSSMSWDCVTTCICILPFSQLNSAMDYVSNGQTTIYFYLLQFYTSPKNANKNVQKKLYSDNAGDHPNTRNENMWDFFKRHTCVWKVLTHRKDFIEKHWLWKKNLTIYTEAFKNKSVSMIKSTFSQNKRAYT